VPGFEEHGQGRDSLGIGVDLGFAEIGGHKTQFKIEKWDLDQINWVRKKLRIRPGWEPIAQHFRRLNVRPFETYVKENANIIVDGGWQMLMNGVAGSAVTKFSNGAVGRIMGGDTSTAVAYTQTDLQAAAAGANRYCALINSVPTVGSTHTAGLVLTAQFALGNGNFSWQEFGLDSGTASGANAAVAPFFSRGLATPGTKTSSQTWNATLTYTWT